MNFYSNAILFYKYKKNINKKRKIYSKIRL